MSRCKISAKVRNNNSVYATQYNKKTSLRLIFIIFIVLSSKLYFTSRKKKIFETFLIRKYCIKLISKQFLKVLKKFLS